MFNVFNLEENSPHRRILLFLTIVLVVGYGWVASRAMQSKVVFPRSIVARVKLIHENRENRVSDAIRSERLEVLRAAYELGSLDAVIGMIGGMHRPIELIINADEPLRYQIDGSAIEIGTAVLEGRGQLSKAVLKAWLQQRASDQIAGSLLRMEVASDLLLALLNGRFELESPELGVRLAAEAPANWLASVSSTQGYCASPWRSVELTQLCLALRERSAEGAAPLLEGTDRSWMYRINPLAMRAVLTSVGWKILSSLSLRERIDFFDRWTKHLLEPVRAVRADAPAEQATLEEWRTWTRNELTAILGADEFAPKFERAVKEAGLSAEAPLMVQAFYQAPGLRGDLGHLVQLAIHPSEDLDSSRSLMPRAGAGGRTNTSVIATASSLVLLPGFATLAPGDVARLATRWLVWESCEAPKLHELIEHPLPLVRGQRVLYVEECGKPLSSTYAALFAHGKSLSRGLGVEEFVRVNKTHVFVQLQRSALALAADRGLVTSQNFIADLLTGATGRVPPELGVHVAQWNRRLRAYRVLGAVEAVEWFRMGTLTAVAPGDGRPPSAN